MKTPVKATLVTIAVVVVLVVAGLIYFLVNQSQSATPSSGDGAASPQVVRQSSHVLDDGGEGAVTLVEFLDFECEACGCPTCTECGHFRIDTTVWLCLECIDDMPCYSENLDLNAHNLRDVYS